MPRCRFCGKQLSGGLDTFGEAGNEMCQNCWLNADDWFDAKPVYVSAKLREWQAGKPTVVVDSGWPWAP